jgi:hypothetical protein
LNKIRMFCSTTNRISLQLYMTYLIFVVVQATYNFVIVWQYKKNINCLL